VRPAVIDSLVSSRYGCCGKQKGSYGLRSIEK